MRIFMLIDNLAKGGKERRLVELLKGLSVREDVECHLVVLSDKLEYEAVFDLDVTIHMLPRTAKKYPGLWPKFYKLSKKLRPDLIHCWGSLSLLVGLPAAKSLGIPFINATVADAPPKVSLAHKHYRRCRMTFPFSDAIVGNSHAGLRAYRAPESRSYCIHNGFDFRRLENLRPREEIRERFDIRTPRLVGMVGAFADRKDYFTYIEAAIGLCKERRDLSFISIGGGKNFESCKAMVPETLKDRILFPGKQSDIESIINVFDVGVLTTNQDVHGEGISNAILEYMAIGKPVVATDGGGSGELVVEGETGFLIPQKSPQSLSEKLEWLLDNPDEARLFGRRGIERVQHHFNLKDMTGHYLDLYERVLEGRTDKNLQAGIA